MTKRKCDTCGVTVTARNSGANYKAQSYSRCKTCNAERARQWRKQNPGYRGSGKITSIPPEDRLLASAISSRLTDAKARAKKRGHPVDVDREYLYQLFKDQDRKCALSGVDLRIEKKHVCCLSLDQIDPEKGYIKGNVQWVAWAVNRAKGDMPAEMFIDMCSKILDYQKVQRLSNSTAA